MSWMEYRTLWTGVSATAILRLYPEEVETKTEANGARCMVGARSRMEVTKGEGSAEAQFSGASAATGQFSVPLSGRQFSISVLLRQRLGSKSHETGSIWVDLPNHAGE